MKMWSGDWENLRYTVKVWGATLEGLGCPEDGGGSGRSSQVMSSQAGVKD